MSKHETRRRVGRAILVLLTAFLIFAGPTYVVYLTQRIGVSYAYSVAFGLALLLLGLAMAYKLIKAGEIK